MSEMKHTPGPWEVWGSERLHRDALLGHGRFIIIGHPDSKEGGFMVCEAAPWRDRVCQMPSAAVRESDRKQCEANAHLIAAAPDLLAATKAVATALDVPRNRFGRLDANKASVLALRPGAKKIAEKFDNLFQSVNAGRKPSVYVMTGFKALSVSGAITGPDMVAAMQADGYSVGTSRSQAQQVMSLFQTLKVAKKDGGKIVLNDQSVIAQALAALV